MTWTTAVTASILITSLGFSTNPLWCVSIALLSIPAIYFSYVVSH